MRTSLAVICLLSSAAALPAAAQQSSQPTPPPADQSAADPSALGDIVVTAQRTRARLQDVPASVTAFSAQAVDQRQISTVLDLSRLVPNTKFDPVTGGSTGLKPYVRGGGVTDGGVVLSESEVGIYVDGIYQARLSAGVLDFLELDRIEVLRGPQGLLYGRNSSAGAVNLITREPGPEFGGTVQVGYGTWNERRLKGYVSGPVSGDGKWRVGLNGLVRARDGGRQYNVTLKRKVGAENFQGAQGDVSYVGDVIKGRLTGFYLNTDTDGQWAVPNNVSANGQVITPATGSYRLVASPIPSYSHVTQYGATLRLSADYPGGALTSTTGYSHLADDWRQDFSGGVPAAALGIPGGGTLALFDRISGTRQRQFSQELQAAGKIGRSLDYVAGTFFFTETADQNLLSTIFFGPSRTVFAARTNSFAGFGQLTLHLTDRLSLIAGGRYTIDDKKLSGAIDAAGFVLHNSYDRFTPKAGIDFKLTPAVLLYASYSQGFKSGGYNGLAGTLDQITKPFLPQYTIAYEAGVKADLFDRRVRINLAAFRNRIENRQQTLTVTSGPAIGTFVVENYNGILEGIEVEATWQVAPWLALWGNAAVNHGYYTSCSVVVVTGCSIVGNQPPVFPDHVYTVGFDAHHAAGPGTPRLGADFNQRAAYFSTADNALIGFVPRQQFLSGYVGYDLGRWSVQVAGKNLLQQQGWQTGFGFSLVQPRFAIEPRTFLGTVRYKF